MKQVLFPAWRGLSWAQLNLAKGINLPSALGIKSFDLAKGGAVAKTGTLWHGKAQERRSWQQQNVLTWVKF